ncbi:PucC family protein [Erythrobacter sanguineus]|uniref:PUCC protein n=1 Tax=Erythrobacter sanguineus TaxID=198312 RepID=A0A1M7SGD4_9SPHN|nr:PucC family protein [Erythrobacter sanguineus]SHN57524.1 PUCC protein [Erythrobacter sanguineus]
MYVSLLLGSIVSALVFGVFLTDFSPGRLIQVIQGCAVVTVFLNLVATWKQEALNSSPPPTDPAAMAGTFRQSWDNFIVQRQALRRMIVIGIGTLAFTMSDALLEPYGAQALGLGVGMTTRLTAILAGGSLVGFTIASQILSRGSDPVRLAGAGALMGLPGFAMIIAAAPIQSASLFSVGVLLIGSWCRWSSVRRNGPGCCGASEQLCQCACGRAGCAFSGRLRLPAEPVSAAHKERPGACGRVFRVGWSTPPLRAGWNVQASGPCGPDVLIQPVLQQPRQEQRHPGRSRSSRWCW